jgi:hypothetical protein
MSSCMNVSAGAAPAEQSPSTPKPHRMKPWCNYSIHRTTSDQQAAGGKARKTRHNSSKRREYRAIQQWWSQR